MSLEHIEDGLAKLDPSEYDPRSAEDIRRWKERVPKLIAQADWLKHPITIEWMQGKANEIRRINLKLSNEPNLSDQERQRLFGEKSAHQFDLSHANIKPEEELRQIESFIKEEVEE